MTNLQIAFLFLIVFSLGFHWAAWRRFSECDATCKELTTRVEWLETRRESQAKQIAGLQTWCNNIDRREDELNTAPPAFPFAYVATNYPKRPDEV